MNYDWLLLERSPKLLVSATKLIGVSEIVGSKSNPTIIQWAKSKFFIVFNLLVE